LERWNEIVSSPTELGNLQILESMTYGQKLVPEIGTRSLEFFTEARRHGCNTSVFQEALENVLTATIVLTSTVVVLEVTSVT